MIWTNTGTIVTMMTNVQPPRDGTEVEYPRYTVRTFAAAEVPVPILQSACPFPAVIFGHTDSIPEPLFNGQLHRIVETGTRTEAGFPAIGFACKSIERSIAVFTGFGDTLVGHQKLPFWCHADGCSSSASALSYPNFTINKPKYGVFAAAIRALFAAVLSVASSNT